MFRKYAVFSTVRHALRGACLGKIDVSVSSTRFCGYAQYRNAEQT
jgi:hypothetical protein